MKTPTRSHPVSNTSRFAGALTFLFLAACATAPVGQGTSAEPEMVDTGYGTVAGGHAATVHGDSSGVPHSRTLAEMLARLPGVQVSQLGGGRVSVRVVGSGSFLASEDPLFVVDGMTMEASALGTLNPDHIESITLLKSPNETALYGSRGANGVILIKTKQGPR
jgi:TonB-dependent SusC/RagA subfamily outer membrane receptor